MLDIPRLSSLLIFCEAEDMSEITKFEASRGTSPDSLLAEI
eukprot:Gb_21694 [translate_table: standard]